MLDVLSLSLLGSNVVRFPYPLADGSVYFSSQTGSLCTGCPRKKSTNECVCYLQVLFGVSRKTVCHKQASLPCLWQTVFLDTHPKQNLQIIHTLYCRLFSGTPCRWSALNLNPLSFLLVDVKRHKVKNRWLVMIVRRRRLGAIKIRELIYLWC